MKPSDDFLNDIWNYAIMKHGDQKYGKILPYSKHLIDVSMILRRFGFDDTLYIALAYLHDVVEDTDAGFDDIDKFFGPQIGHGVFSLTDGVGNNRKERKVELFRKLLKNPEVIPVKIADRIANLEHSIVTSDDDDSLLKMYIKEHDEFKKALKMSSSYEEEMWNHLDYLNDVAKLIINKSKKK